MKKSILKGVVLSSAVLLTACGSPEEKVNGYVERAKTFLEEGNYEAAHIEFANALQINPNHVDALFSVTKVFEQEKDWPKVYRYLEKVIELKPDHVDALMAIGSLELAAQQIDKALTRSDKVLQLRPNAAKSHSFRALVLFKLADMDGAVASAKKALSLDAANTEAMMVLASERLEAKDPDGALAYLEKTTDSNNLLLHVMKVRAYNDQKNLAGAAGVFEQLIALEPDKDEYYFALANQYATFKQFEEGLAALNRLIEAEPDNKRAKTVMVQFIMRFIGVDKAIEQQQQFLAQNPQDIDLNFSLADTYLNNDEADKAKGIWLKVAQFDEKGEGGVKAMTRLARMAYQANDEAQGDQYLEKVTSIDPEHVEVVVLKAQRMMSKGEMAEAITVLRAVLQDNPRSAVVLALLGRAHQAEGRIELAIDQYAKAIEAEPNNKAVLLPYTQLLIAQKNYQLADQLLSARSNLIANDVPLLRQMAQIKLMTQDWNAAQSIANRLEELSTDTSVSSQIRGAVHLAKEEHSASIEAFETAYQQAEDKTRPMMTLVRSYMALNKREEALNFLDAVLQADQDNFTAMLLKAQILHFSGDLAAAEAVSREIVRLHTDQPHGYRQLSGLLFRSGKVKESLVVMDQAISALPDDASLKFLKASMLEQAGDIKAAVEMYEAILSADPEADIAANNLAVIYSENEDFLDMERAQALAKRFRQSEVPYFLDTLGWINYKSGKLNDALYFHENAVEAMPDFAEFRYHLGMSYKAVGDADKARVELEKALTLAEKDKAAWKQEAELALKSLK